MSTVTVPAAPVRRVAPVVAWLAAGCGLVGALPVAFFALFVGLLSLGYEDWRGAVLGAVPAVAFLLVLVGAVLLLTGRSWLVLVLGSALCVGFVGVGLAAGDLREDPAALLWLGGGPLLAVVLGSLPVVRHWVAARRAARG
ncbi:hypothetical protein [Modestobacter sp. Leaf380]|uniref:hypothetical protein n=1 Tax=Modestobacter sp. Leaf380 TaxID=1736356 RepID=UPI0006F2625C|nr:hypothetical protein [Modestobacter sp. Leaf380]KQS64887.1 hypothetical protein ASG41_15670 [Modestobacter sp. Leaf380]